MEQAVTAQALAAIIQRLATIREETAVGLPVLSERTGPSSADVTRREAMRQTAKASTRQAAKEVADPSVLWSAAAPATEGW